MRKLLHKIMLDCNEATHLVSIKKYHKLSVKQRIQLSLHLMACKLCKDYSDFNDLVDDTMDHVCELDHDKKMSDEKKQNIQSIIDKEIKQ